MSEEKQKEHKSMAGMVKNERGVELWEGEIYPDDVYFEDDNDDYDDYDRDDDDDEFGYD